MSPRTETPLRSRPGAARPERKGRVRPSARTTAIASFDDDAAPTGSEWGERTLLGAAEAVPLQAHPSGLPESSAPAAARATARSFTRGRRKAGRPHRVPFAVLLVGVIAAGMCALLALNTATAASEVRERHVDAINASLSAKQEQLSRDVADTQAPAELARMAARLGLVPAGSPAFLRLNADGTFTVLGAPAKVPTPPVPLTPAQKAAAKAAAIAKAAKDKAAKDKAAKDKAAKSTTAQTKSPTATGKAPVSGAKTTAPRTTAPGTTAPGTTAPTTTAPTTTAPKAATTTSPVPTVTIPGGPR